MCYFSRLSRAYTASEARMNGGERRRQEQVTLHRFPICMHTTSRRLCHCHRRVEYKNNTRGLRNGMLLLLLQLLRSVTPPLSSSAKLGKASRFGSIIGRLRSLVHIRASDAYARIINAAAVIRSITSLTWIIGMKNFKGNSLSPGFSNLFF